MSTYNGEKYLKAQLDSIFNQTSQILCYLFEMMVRVIVP